MFGDLFRDLEARFPWLSTWFGGRLEIELPAFLVSLTMHGLLLVGLAFAGYRVHQESSREFQSGVVDNLVPSSIRRFRIWTSRPIHRRRSPRRGRSHRLWHRRSPRRRARPGACPLSAATDIDARRIAPELVKLDVRRATEVVVPTATMLGQTVSIRGNGAELVGGVEGAVDRIAIEILRHLEQGRTLVVWAFDASGSLQAERQRLSKHIETVYTHINQLDESHLSADSGLLTMVVSFGQDRQALLAQADGRAVRDHRGDQERPPGHDRRRDDVHHGRRDRQPLGPLQGRSQPGLSHDGHRRDRRGRRRRGAARGCHHAWPSRPRCPSTCSARRPSSAGSRATWTTSTPRPSTSSAASRCEQGPESVMLEQIRLPFWYGGPQYEIVEAGFGPYALSRLASATGGIYFVTRFDTRRMGFDPARMREYKPDWDRRDRVREADRRLAVAPGGPERRADHPAEAARHAQLCTFPPADAPEFKDVMAVNQGIAERTAYTVDEALGPINAVAKLRDRETSRRWQAHYDLIRGRLLAMKVRCYEYNWACARMKKDPPKFSNPKSNAWRLVPDTKIQYSEKAAAAGQRGPNAPAPRRRGSSGHPLGPARRARAERPPGLQVGRDLRAATTARQRQRGRAKRKNKTRQSGQAAGNAQAIVEADCWTVESNA